MNVLHRTQSDVSAAPWVDENSRRIFVDIGSCTVTMSADEARALAATLSAAAQKAQPLVALPGIITGNDDLVERAA